MSNTTNNTKTQDLITIFNDKVANDERVTLTHLAKEVGLTPAQARRSLCEVFGASISFTRGRTGGIHLITP